MIVNGPRYAPGNRGMKLTTYINTFSTEWRLPCQGRFYRTAPDRAIALGGSSHAHKCRDHAPYFAHARSAVKKLIIKYFCHSHSSGVQPSGLVQGGFKVGGNIAIYMEKSKPSQSGVGHCRSKWSLAPF